jgi:hypothetical protein
MKSPFCVSLAFALLVTLVLPARSQELPELLRPVEAESVARLHEPTNYGFRLQRYAAKRYRVVDINFDLLSREGAEFTITPFEDLQIRLKAKQTRGLSSQGQLREWVGTQVLPGEIKWQVEGQSMSPPELPVTLWVRTGEHDVPSLSGDWIVFTRGKRVAIRPIDDDPRYHIVYEIDEEKMPQSAHGGEESSRKLQAFKEFKEQLEKERAHEEGRRAQ